MRVSRKVTLEGDEVEVRVRLNVSERWAKKVGNESVSVFTIRRISSMYRVLRRTEDV